MERERKEKMDKIKHKELAFKKKLLYSEAQRIISGNVGKFEKGSYIIRTEDRRKGNTAFDGRNAPSWQPTGYYNEIEYTRNTKKMADSFENKKGIFRLFSFTRTKYAHSLLQMNKIYKIHIVCFYDFIQRVCTHIRLNIHRSLKN